MYAIITRDESSIGAALLPIAGLPVVGRQLQWLMNMGCDRIAIELGDDFESDRVAEWLSRHALASSVTAVMSGRRLTPRQVAHRAGFPTAAPLLVLAANVLGNGDLARLFPSMTPDGLVADFEAPANLEDLDGAVIRIVDGERGSARKGSWPMRLARQSTIDGGGSSKRCRGPGWAVRIRSLSDAFRFSCALLERKLTSTTPHSSWLPEMHAAEQRPGVWIARGASISASAKLIAPVLIGSGAVVGPDCIVGPRAIIEPDAVLDRQVVLRNAVVLERTVVGGKLTLDGVAVEPRALTDLRTAERFDIDDVLIASERRPARLSVASRVIAAFVVAILAPVAALGRLLGHKPAPYRTVLVGDRAARISAGGSGWAPLDWMLRVVDVIRGVRGWVGVADEPLPAAPYGTVSPRLYLAALSAPRGVISIDEALVPDCSDVSSHVRGIAWYAHAKGVRLDLLLVWRRLLGRGTNVGFVPASEKTS
jgi:hypothetical protein